MTDNMKSKFIFNPVSNISLNATIADTFLTKLAGLMFRKSIPIDTCLILSERYESILNTSIHMLFMRFNIGVIWLSKDFSVVDKKLAKKWHPAYFSRFPAQHVIELHPTQLENFSIGDKLIYPYEDH